MPSTTVCLTVAWHPLPPLVIFVKSPTVSDVSSWKQTLKRKVHTFDIELRRDINTEALSYGTHCQGTLQFCCTPTCWVRNCNQHTCTCLSLHTRSRLSFTDPGGMEGWAGLSHYLQLLRLLFLTDLFDFVLFGVTTISRCCSWLG